MKTIAVIGLGIMGHGIADNFLKQNYGVIVWNRSKQKAQDLLDKGAMWAVSPKEAAEQADIIFEVTANDESSQKVWLGNDGILAASDPSKVYITCATVSVEWTDKLVDECNKQKLSFFDMPMTGGRVAAETGQLTLLIGGDKSKLDAITPDLEAVAKVLRYMGKAGSGMRYKLILNTLQAIHMAGLGEALRMADAAGLDKQLVGEALVERPGGAITSIAWDSYQQDSAPLTFSVEWMAKDLGYATEMAHATDHPLLNEARKLYQEAIKMGFSQDDWTKINKLDGSK